MSAWRGRHAAAGVPPGVLHSFVEVAGAAPGAVLTRALRRLAQQRPELFERLGAHKQALFALEVTDVPLRFLLWPRGRRGEVRVFARGSGGVADATVAGRLDALLAMALGRRDADSGLFARELSISGDTAALVALRNTLDASGLHLADFLGVPRVAADMLERVTHLLRRMAGALDASWTR